MPSYRKSKKCAGNKKEFPAATVPPTCAKLTIIHMYSAKVPPNPGRVPAHPPRPAPTAQKCVLLSPR